MLGNLMMILRHLQVAPEVVDGARGAQSAPEQELQPTIPEQIGPAHVEVRC